MLTVKRLTSITAFVCLSLQGCSHAPDTANQMASTDTAPRAWETLTAGGEAICSDGTDYRFMVNRGDPAKLVFFLQGGGGCWSRETCDTGMMKTYTVNTENLQPPVEGMFDFNNPANPFADHTVVFASYCSGDVHLGGGDTVYPAAQDGQTPLTIHHRGQTNMAAVLDWTYANITQPEHVFVTGSSAGAIPTPIVASQLANHYLKANITQLGDAAGGYRRGVPNHNVRDQWQAFPKLHQVKGFEHVDPDTFVYEKLYVAATKAHPNITFARYDNAEDGAQKYFLSLRNAPTKILREALIANHNDIAAESNNIRSFIAPGNPHTIMGKPEFYTTRADGVAFVDWVAQIARGEQIDNVFCNECQKP